jgi:hypothetical protein
MWRTRMICSFKAGYNDENDDKIVVIVVKRQVILVT